MSGTTTRVVSVEMIEENVDPKEIPNDGIVSYQFINYEDMDDELMNSLWEESPDVLLEHRPEWVLLHHPEAIN